MNAKDQILAMSDSEVASANTKLAKMLIKKMIVVSVTYVAVVAAVGYALDKVEHHATHN